MEIRKNQCDIKGCKTRNASQFTIFKERKADGAGGMENWHYAFDICPSCVAKLFQEFLSAKTSEDGNRFIAKHGINARIG